MKRNPKTRSQILSLPVRTDRSYELECPFCGGSLSYKGAIIIQHTIDEIGNTHPLELNIDAYGGAVNVKGLSRDEAADDISSIGVQYRCIECDRLEDFRLLLSEESDGDGALMHWVNLKYEA